MRLGTAGAGCLLLLLAGCAQNDLLLQKQAELEGRVEQIAKGNAAMSTRLSELESSLSRLQNQVKGTATLVDELKGKIDEPRLSPQDIRSQSLPSESTSAPSPKIEVINSEPATKDKDSTASDAYIKAFGVYSTNNYPAAIEAFGAFIGNYPDSEYAANAQYWMGECYYTQKSYPQALESFRKVVDGYPKSNKVPDAMLKIGFSHISMNEPDKAKAVLEGLVAKYPKSHAAVKAKDRLKESRFRSGT